MGILVDQELDQYNWEIDTQRDILSLLFKDKTFLLQSFDLVKPEYFRLDAHRMLANILFKFYDKYLFIPSRNQVIEELNNNLSNKKQDIINFYKAEVIKVLDFSNPGINSREYYQDKILNFAKKSAIKIAFLKCSKLISENKDDFGVWDNVEEVLRQALLVNRNFNLGLNYFETLEERYERTKNIIKVGEVFSSGFDGIDIALDMGGLTRGQMACYMGLSGTGKSWCLVNAAIKNLDRGKRVLYVSLEGSEDKTASRFDLHFANPLADNDIISSNLINNEAFVINQIKSYINEQGFARNDMLMIKRFPSGSMGVSELKAYYQQLLLNGFKPDLVIIDYIGEMKDIPGIKTYESRYRIIRDLRGFAVEENVCLFSALQANRKGKEVIKEFDVLDDASLSDSFDQVKPLDALWTINRNPVEDSAGLARIFVSKHRDGSDKFMIYTIFNKKNLKFYEISKSRYEKIAREQEVNIENEATQSTNSDLKQGFRKKLQSKEIDSLVPQIVMDED